MATTFINKKADVSVLMDLRHLLIEAGQELPQFLKELTGEQDQTTCDVVEGDEGCAYCSGLGHRITNCPKLESVRNKTTNSLLRPDLESQKGF